MLRSGPCGRLSAGVVTTEITRRAGRFKAPLKSTRKWMHCGGRHANLRADRPDGGSGHESCDRELTSCVSNGSPRSRRLPSSAQAHAQEPRPALVYDLGGKFDKSFNEAAYDGAEKFKAETGVEYRDFEIQNDSQREQAFRNFARRRHNPDHRHMASARRRAMKKVAAGVPRHAVRHHRHGGRPAERALGRLQGAGGLLSRRHARGDGLEDRQGRLRRRHGHPAHPQIRLRLRARREGGQSGRPRSSRT